MTQIEIEKAVVYGNSINISVPTCYFCHKPLVKEKTKEVFFRFDDESKQVINVEVCESCYKEEKSNDKRRV